MVAIFAESLTLGDFSMHLDHSLTQQEAAGVPCSQGFQGFCTENFSDIVETGFAVTQTESLSERPLRSIPIVQENDFNRPLKRSLSKAVVLPFGEAVKINPEAKTLAKEAI